MTRRTKATTTPRGRWLKDSRTKITRPYGVPGPYAAGFHTGVDLAVPGAGRIPVVWALRRPGRVVSVNQCGRSYGTHVVIRSAGGRAYLFAHLSDLRVVVGDLVDNGHLIGLTGATGNVTGDHLHLERAQGPIWRYGSVSRPPVFRY